MFQQRSLVTRPRLGARLEPRLGARLDNIMLIHARLQFPGTVAVFYPTRPPSSCCLERCLARNFILARCIRWNLPK